MPKKKNYQYDNKEIKIHIAYYKKNGQILAICEDKKMLKEYLEFHRKLNLSQVNIETEHVEASYIYNRYEDYILSEFYNLYIPIIDINIINMEYGGFERDLESLINKMKYFSFILPYESSNDKQDFDIIKNSIEIIEKFKNKSKKYNKLLKSHLLSHPILTCKIDDYFYFIRKYNEYKQNIESYEYMCNKD